MNAPNPQAQTSVLDRFGKMLGAVAGFLGTNPLYLYTYHYFEELVLRYANYGSHPFWSIVWKVCLFFLILTATWFALVLAVNVLKGLLIGLIVLFRKGGR